MTRRDGAWAKKVRLQEIAKMISEGSDIPLSKLIATLEIKYGLTKRRIREYLDTLELAGLITIDPDKNTVSR